MNNKIKGLIALLIILILIIVGLTYETVNCKQNIFNGLWECTEDFCEKSEIDHMYVTIKHDSMRKYTMSVIMIKNGVIILDEVLNFIRCTFTDTLTLEDKSEAFPKEMKYLINYEKGKMIWYDDKNKYAEFVRKYLSD